MGKPGAMEVLDLNEEHPSQVFYHSVREKTILHDSIATSFSSWITITNTNRGFPMGSLRRSPSSIHYFRLNRSSQPISPIPGQLIPFFGFISLFELFNDNRVCQGGGVSNDITIGYIAQQPAHDFPATGFRQFSRDENFLQSGD